MNPLYKQTENDRRQEQAARRGLKTRPRKVGEDGLMVDESGALPRYFIRCCEGGKVEEIAVPTAWAGGDWRAEQYARRFLADFHSRGAQCITTVATLLDRYDAEQAGLSTAGGSTVSQIRAALKNVLACPIDDFDIALVQDALEAMAEGGPARAQRACYSLRTLENWAVYAGYADQLLGFQALYIHANRPRRSRELSIEELAEIFVRCDDLGFPFGPATRLLVILGAEQADLMEMRADGLAQLGEKLTWRPHRWLAEISPMTLPPAAATLIHGAMASSNRKPSERVLSTTGRNQTSAWPHAKTRLDEAINRQRRALGRASMPAWQLRDVRKAVRQHLTQEGQFSPFEVGLYFGDADTQDLAEADHRSKRDVSTIRNRIGATWCEKMLGAITAYRLNP